MAHSSPLRVLHVYSGNLYGGIETFLRALAEERDQCPEMQPEFALCFEGRIADEIRASGAPLHMLGGVRLSRPWSVVRAQRNFAKVLRTRRPDVVVCHAAWPYAIFASVVRAAKTRLVFYRHDIGGARDWMNKLAGRVQPDVVIANSKYTAKHAYPKFENVEQHVVYPVVRPAKTNLGTNARAALRSELGTDPEDVVILQVSRMQPGKGQTLLLDALAQLPQTLRWKCWMVGDAQRPSERAYLDVLHKQSANDNVLCERVQFLGQRDDIAALMEGADIFCQPNLSPESFGIVIVEALSARLPVVTTNLAGGALEIIDSSCGAHVEPTGRDLGDGLSELAENGRKRRQFGRASETRALAFTDARAQLRALVSALSFHRSNEPLRPTFAAGAQAAGVQ